MKRYLFAKYQLCSTSGTLQLTTIVGDVNENICGNHTTYGIGNIIELNCPNGYIMKPNEHSLLTCGSDRQWHRDDLIYDFSGISSPINPASIYCVLDNSKYIYIVSEESMS